MTHRPKLRGLAPRRLRLIPAVGERAEDQLPPSEVQRGMRLSIAEGVFAQAWGVVTAGVFVTGLALLLGASNFHLGLIGVLPVAAQLVQLFAAWWVERRGSRRYITVLSSLGRQLWLVPVLLVYVPLDPGLRLALAIAAMALASGSMAVSSNAWLNWMSDLIPPALRGRFFGARSTVLAVATIAAVWSAGALLDYSRGVGRVEDGYLLLFALACSAGLASTILLRAQPEPPLRAAARQNFRALLSAPLADRRFRSFTLTMLAWAVFVNLASPFFAAHALKNLHLSFQELAAMDVLTAGVSIASQPLWGIWADRIGHKRVLGMALLGAAPLALTWLFVTPENVWLLYLNAGVAGIFWPGIALALNNRLMELAPPQGRGSYLAAYSAVTGIGAFAASLGAGVLIDALGGAQLPLGPLVLNNYLVVFLVAGVARIVVAVAGRRYL